MILFEVENSVDIIFSEGLLNLSEVKIFPFVCIGELLGELRVSVVDIFDEFFDYGSFFLNKGFVDCLELLIFLKLHEESFPNFREGKLQLLEVERLGVGVLLELENGRGDSV